MHFLLKLCIWPAYPQKDGFAWCYSEEQDRATVQVFEAGHWHDAKTQCGVLYIRNLVGFWSSHRPAMFPPVSVLLHSQKNWKYDGCVLCGVLFWEHFWSHWSKDILADDDVRQGLKVHLGTSWYNFPIVTHTRTVWEYSSTVRRLGQYKVNLSWNGIDCWMLSFPGNFQSEHSRSPTLP